MSRKLLEWIAQEEVIKIHAQEEVSLSVVKEITKYFHGNSVKFEAQPFRIFMVVRDFLTVLDRVCKEGGSINMESTQKLPVLVNRGLVFDGFHGKRQYFTLITNIRNVHCFYWLKE